MSFKLIALDLDGTIVTAKNVISPKTIEVLKETNQKGIKIFIVTGRSLFNAISVLKKYQIFKLVDTILATNGSVIYDVAKDLVLDFKTIPFSLLEKINTKIIELELALVLTPIAEDKPSYYVGHKPGKKEIDFFLNELFPITFSLLHSTKISSGIVLSDMEHLDKIHTFTKFIKAETNLEIVAGSPHSVQFSNSDKGTSLLEVVKKHRIDINQVLVLGDSPNDVPMFKAFPHSVAMNNAFGGAKLHASYLTESIEEDGAPRAIEKLVFGVTVQNSKN